MGKGGVKRGTRGVTEGKKRGRNAYHERESEGEEAVQACSVTAHDLYKGMGNLYMAGRNFENREYSTFCFYLCNLYSFFSVYLYHCACAV